MPPVGPQVNHPFERWLQPGPRGHRAVLQLCRQLPVTMWVVVGEVQVGLLPRRGLHGHAAEAELFDDPLYGGPPGCAWHRRVRRHRVHRRGRQEDRQQALGHTPVPAVRQHSVPCPVIQVGGVSVPRRDVMKALADRRRDDMEFAGLVGHHRLLRVVPGCKAPGIGRPPGLGGLRQLLSGPLRCRAAGIVLGRRGGARQLEPARRHGRVEPEVVYHKLALRLPGLLQSQSPIGPVFRPLERLPGRRVHRGLQDGRVEPPQPGPRYPPEVRGAHHDRVDAERLGHRVGVRRFHDDVLEEEHPAPVGKQRPGLPVKLRRGQEQRPSLAGVAGRLADAGEILARRGRRDDYQGFPLRVGFLHRRRHRRGVVRGEVAAMPEPRKPVLGELDAGLVDFPRNAARGLPWVCSRIAGAAPMPSKKDRRT